MRIDHKCQMRPEVNLSSYVSRIIYNFTVRRHIEVVFLFDKKVQNKAGLAQTTGPVS